MSILKCFIVICTLIIFVFISETVKASPTTEVANAIGYMHYCNPLGSEATDILINKLAGVDTTSVEFQNELDKQLDVVLTLLERQGYEAICVILSLVSEDQDLLLFNEIVNLKD